MTNIYQALYDLLNQYVFGNSVVVGTYPDLLCTLISGTACVFLVALPFLVVWKIIKLIMGR